MKQSRYKIKHLNLSLSRIAKDNSTMNDLLFSDRDEFRKWLTANCLSADGIWLLFGKHSNPKTIKPDEALEEALCFGWIDGQIQSIDENTYIFYYASSK